MGVRSLPKMRTMKADAALIISIPNGVATSQAEMEDGQEGMTLYNELYLKVRGDRQKDNGAFGWLYMLEHRVSFSGKKWKRRNANGADHNNQLAISDDLEQLWTAAEIEEI